MVASKATALPLGHTPTFCVRILFH